MLTGLWHGESWNFILWGLYYGIILLIEKFFIKKDHKWYRVVTLIIVLIGWLIFRQTNFNDLLMSLKALFGGYGLGDINTLLNSGIFSVRYILAIIFGIILSFNVIKVKNEKVSDILLLILFIISIISLVVSSYNPFIYFRF
jgi:alginate O-acetyltransferase complex protein AlgI